MIQQSFEAELLTTVQYVETGEEEQQKRKKSIMIFILFSSITVSIVAAFIIVWLRGHIVI